MFDNNKLCLQHVFSRFILHYILEGSGSWKYNHYFPVAKDGGEIKKRESLIKLSVYEETIDMVKVKCEYLSILAMHQLLNV